MKTGLTIPAAAGLFLAVSSCSAVAGALEDGRIAIVHASQSTIRDDQENHRDVLTHLRESGVQVIGRYLARCRQGSKGNGLWTKRIINGGAAKTDEADAILSAGLAIISVYQYKSGDNGVGLRKFTRGLGEVRPADCEDTEADKAISARPNPAERVSMSPTDEGMLDSQAAARQAHAIHQPANTPIYFGIDYDIDISDAAQKQGVLEYFRQVRAELKKPENRYLVGAYGNGDVLGLLMSETLVDFTWISPSASYGGTSRFHSGGKWNIFQSEPDNSVAYTNSGQCFEFEYDADIQNKNLANQNVGAWNRSGSYLIPQVRTNAVFDQRRFTCNIRNVIPEPSQSTCKGVPSPVTCGKASCFARVVRIKPEQASSATDLVIDFHDYGTFGGHGFKGSLTRSLAIKPLWDDGERSKQACTCDGSDQSKPCPQ